MPNKIASFLSFYDIFLDTKTNHQQIHIMQNIMEFDILLAANNECKIKTYFSYTGIELSLLNLMLVVDMYG